MISTRAMIRSVEMGILLAACSIVNVAAQPPQSAPPAAEPAIVLNLPASVTDPTKIEYAALPTVRTTHAVVCPLDPDWKFQLHNYLIHHDGRYWCFWSHGPVVEDKETQHLRYATSDDGLHWGPSKQIVGPPEAPYAYIARGFWLRDGELLALAAHFRAPGAFGVNKELQLRAFLWDKAADTWREKGLLYENAINNFSPVRLASGEWLMTRRDARFNVYMLRGGVKTLDDWQSFPVVQRLQYKGFSPDEPFWWPLPDGRLMALFRDNGGSSRLFRAFSSDQGQTWSKPEITNFPNATSKFFALKTSRGYWAMISNANPTIGRRQLHVSLSDDGVTFTRMAHLEVPSERPSTLQYPHAIEHDGHLLVAFSRLKATTELVKVSLADLDALREKK